MNTVTTALNTQQSANSMNDYELIKETIFDYFEGYMTKDRGRLEKAFNVNVANMVGYWKNPEGEQELIFISMKEEIDDWVSPEHSTFAFGEGKIISIHIFSKDGATAVFDCGGRFLDTFQLLKMDGSWKIVNKFFVDQ
jgi:hypothetical protein